MDRAILIETVARETGKTTDETRQIVDKMIDTMLKTFSDGESIDMGLDFGRFEVREREAERFKNGGKQIKLPNAKSVVVFKASRQFKKTINGGSEDSQAV